MLRNTNLARAPGEQVHECRSRGDTMMQVWLVILGLLAVLLPGTGPNRPPLTGADYAFLPDYLPYVVVDVLANDVDPDGDALEVTEILGVTNGYAFVLKDDRVLFWWKDATQPHDGWIGYLVDDGRGGLAKGEVWVECCAGSPSPPAPSPSGRGGSEGLAIMWSYLKEL